MRPTAENVLFLHAVAVEAFGGSEGMRHPFIEGNKRTTVYAAAYLLETFGYQLEVGQQDPEDFAVSVAEGTIDTMDLVHWFENHSSRRT